MSAHIHFTITTIDLSLLSWKYYSFNIIDLQIFCFMFTLSLHEYETDMEILERCEAAQ